MTSSTDRTQHLREAGLRVTRQRVAVLDALTERPHASAETVRSHVLDSAGRLSLQAVYDVLAALTSAGLVRRIQPAGSVALFEVRVGDNHHHVVCRECGAVSDVECVVGEGPCLDAGPPGDGFMVDEAEVTYWGRCASCAARTPPAGTGPVPSRQVSAGVPSGQRTRVPDSSRDVER